jgi:decaprenylphospho-beta-D-erythro-pentofuranosid-2-ulose 2-reductase
LKKIFIHGGSSEITKNLVKFFYYSFDEFHIFVRNFPKAKKNLAPFDKKIIFYVNSLDNIEKTLIDIENLPNDLTSIIWLSGSPGESQKEFADLDLCKKTIEINFTNVVLSLNLILQKKLLIKSESFLCVFTSVAGLRGRHFNTFYGAAKSGLISYLSSLRQRFNNKLLVLTVIPGYMRTNKYTLTTPTFLTSSPEKSAKIVYESIKKKKEIIYIDYKWALIMKIISFIPEIIFKKLKF